MTNEGGFMFCGWETKCKFTFSWSITGRNRIDYQRDSRVIVKGRSQENISFRGCKINYFFMSHGVPCNSDLAVKNVIIDNAQMSNRDCVSKLF